MVCMHTNRGFQNVAQIKISKTMVWVTLRSLKGFPNKAWFQWAWFEPKTLSDHGFHNLKPHYQTRPSRFRPVPFQVSVWISIYITM